MQDKIYHGPISPGARVQTQEKDMVKSPKHYTGALAEQLGIEVIDVANALNLNGNRFSILRYVCRAGLKDKSKEIEDLQKIIEYATFEIRRLENLPVSNTRYNQYLTQSLNQEPKE